MGSAVRARFRRGHMTDWATNPLTRGAYSAARPGRQAARAVLALPLGERVFFAGEAVSQGYAALCTGAHLSGEATAIDVITTLTGAACSACDARGQQRRPLGGGSE